jgi:hypothetical protein
MALEESDRPAAGLQARLAGIEIGPVYIFDVRPDVLVEQLGAMPGPVALLVVCMAQTSQPSSLRHAVQRL